MPGLLEYANLVTPELVEAYVPSFEHRDPLLKLLRSKNKRIRSGGENVRIRRVKGRHSDAVQIDGTNITVPLVKVDTFSYMSGDWGRIIKPIILPHIDRDRLTSKQEVKRWIDATVKAAMSSHMIAFTRRLYTSVATNVAYRQIGSLNGAVGATAGTVSGFTNGAIRWQTPAAQAAASVTYLNETRVQDTVHFTDNWFNQYGQHSGIGTDFLETVKTVKLTADSYTEEEGEGIRLGLLSITDHVAMGEEVMAYPGAGGVSSISYTVDDVVKGRSHPTVHIVGGIHYYSNRWINATDLGVTEGCYLLNPDGIEYWVNANNDHRVTKFTDHLETSNQDADVAYIVIEVQFAVPHLLLQGGVSQ